MNAPAADPAKDRWRDLFHGADRSQVLYAALTFIVVIIIILVCPDAVTAIAILSPLAVLAYLWRRDGGGCHEACCREKFEGFGLPGNRAPFPVAAPPPRAAPPPDRGRYRGAIDADDYDTYGAMGHRDRAEGDDEGAPYGNPYNTSRGARPFAAAADIDDEANDDEIDGDERLAYQGRSRNDPTRVAAGTMNRRKDLEKYLEEEVESEEQREWWGRHEY